MSGTGKLFELAAQGQAVDSLDLMVVHVNIGAVLDLCDKAHHDDNLDKLVELAEMLLVLAKRHRFEHRLLAGEES